MAVPATLAGSKKWASHQKDLGLSGIEASEMKFLGYEKGSKREGRVLNEIIVMNVISFLSPNVRKYRNNLLQHEGKQNEG